MTGKECIAKVKRLRDNCFYDDKDLFDFIKNCDRYIFTEVISHYENSGVYTAPDMSSTLLVGEPYDSIYIWFVISQIDLALGDSERYVNSLQAYEAVNTAFRVNYASSHMPLQSERKFF